MAEGRQRRGKPRQMQYSMMTDSYRQGVRPSLIKPIMHIAYPPISAKFINSPYFPKIYKFHPYFHQTYKFPPISAKFISSSPFWFFGLNLRFWLPLFLTWCIYIILCTYMYWCPWLSKSQRGSTVRGIGTSDLPKEKEN